MGNTAKGMGEIWLKIKIEIYIAKFSPGAIFFNINKTVLITNLEYQT